MINGWKENLEKFKFIIVVSLDYQRAFETIDRELFILKAQKYGFSENSLKWFTSYLKERKQKTKINEKVSEEIANEIKIPQGAVLSCLMFIIFINDIKMAVKYSSLNLFADDSTLPFACNNIEDGIIKINHDLNSIFEWTFANKLSLNVTKTKVMIIAPRSKNFCEICENHKKKILKLTKNQSNLWTKSNFLDL